MTKNKVPPKERTGLDNLTEQIDRIWQGLNQKGYATRSKYYDCTVLLTRQLSGSVGTAMTKYFYILSTRKNVFYCRISAVIILGTHLQQDYMNAEKLISK